MLNKDLHRLDEAHAPLPNGESARQSPILRQLFESEVPDAVEGFECADRDLMDTIWPAGTNNARKVRNCGDCFLERCLTALRSKVLDRFLRTKARGAQLGAVDPLAAGEEESQKRSRLLDYAEGRNRADRDTSSRLR